MYWSPSDLYFWTEIDKSCTSGFYGIDEFFDNVEADDI